MPQLSGNEPILGLNSCAGIGVGRGGFWMGATCIGCCIFGFMGSASGCCVCGGGKREGGLKPRSNCEIFEGYCG
jgi:hypothetical protein